MDLATLSVVKRMLNDDKVLWKGFGREKVCELYAGQGQLNFIAESDHPNRI